MAKYHDGLLNPYAKLKEIFEDSRNKDTMMQDLDEDKLMQNLLIYTVSLEHRMWFVGFEIGMRDAHKMWFQGILSGTIQVNINRSLHDSCNNKDSIFINQKK